jgi:L-lysine 2,3-aminomutase
VLVLEFDHRDPSDKVKAVAVLAMSKRWPKVLTEVNKCDVRCVNCHRRRTARQFGWRKLR